MEWRGNAVKMYNLKFLPIVLSSVSSLALECIERYRGRPASSARGQHVQLLAKGRFSFHFIPSLYSSLAPLFLLLPSSATLTNAHLPPNVLLKTQPKKREIQPSSSILLSHLAPKNIRK